MDLVKWGSQRRRKSSVAESVDVVLAKAETYLAGIFNQMCKQEDTGWDTSEKLTVII